MRRLRFTVRAREDLSSIAKQSQARWGVEQRIRYVAEIRRRLAQLCERPELGPSFGPGRPGLRRLSVGQHIVFYRFDDDRVRVVRILDQRMDIETHLTSSDDP